MGHLLLFLLLHLWRIASHTLYVDPLLMPCVALAAPIIWLVAHPHDFVRPRRRLLPLTLFVVPQSHRQIHRVPVEGSGFSAIQ
jgi:hypothetical protein